MSSYSRINDKRTDSVSEMTPVYQDWSVILVQDILFSYITIPKSYISLVRQGSVVKK